MNVTEKGRLIPLIDMPVLSLSARLFSAQAKSDPTGLVQLAMRTRDNVRLLEERIAAFPLGMKSAAFSLGTPAATPAASSAPPPAPPPVPAVVRHDAHRPLQQAAPRALVMRPGPNTSTDVPSYPSLSPLVPSLNRRPGPLRRAQQRRHSPPGASWTRGRRPRSSTSSLRRCGTVSGGSCGGVCRTIGALGLDAAPIALALTAGPIIHTLNCPPRPIRRDTPAERHQSNFARRPLTWRHPLPAQAITCVGDVLAACSGHIDKFAAAAAGSDSSPSVAEAAQTVRLAYSELARARRAAQSAIAGERAVSTMLESDMQSLAGKAARLDMVWRAQSINSPLLPARSSSARRSPRATRAAVSRLVSLALSLSSWRASRRTIVRSRCGCGSRRTRRRRRWRRRRARRRTTACSWRRRRRRRSG